MNAGMKDLLNVMSKFLVLGMPLPEVVQGHLEPRQADRQDTIGHLSVGAPADVAVLRLRTGTIRLPGH